MVMSSPMMHQRALSVAEDADKPPHACTASIDAGE